MCVKRRAAAARGDMAVVQLLLSRGADITAADASLSTPFLAAVNGGHETVAMLLLAQQPSSVDLNTRVFGSNCALYCAAGEGLLRVTKALLQRGADCNVSTEETCYISARVALLNCANILANGHTSTAASGMNQHLPALASTQ
jgi:ankyrin repeat protein